ncbi:MAG: alpha/beta fold hydrolase, partial [Candidatus Riflebacteria bacterium]|nr:alpha/beta fold hydrolase [Candidatus Riflebacteria bacterium]
RLDLQVKLRGHRIEVGEIEAVLADHPGVRQGAVSVGLYRAGEERLVAHVAPRPAAILEVEELRRFLGRKLPEVMVPSRIHLVDALPLNPNGKVDRRRLAELMPEEAADGAPGILPRDSMELEIAGLFEELLGVPDVGVDRSFFDLGGHSLLVIRLLAAIQTRFGVALPVAMVFREPTVAQLAGHVRLGRREVPWTPLVPLQAGGAGTPLFLVHPAGGSPLCFLHLARLMGRDRPLFGLEAAGLDPGRSPDPTVNAMATRYVQAVRGARSSGPYLIGGYSAGGVVALEMARMLEQQGLPVARVLLLETLPPALTGHGGPEGDDQLQQLIDLARSVEIASGLAVGLTRELLERERPEDRLTMVVRRLRELELVRPDTGSEFLTGMLAVGQAMTLAVRAHEVVPCRAPVVLFRATGESPAPAGDGSSDPVEIWRLLLDGAVEVEPVPGSHHTVLVPPHVDVLAQRLLARLGR